MTLSCVESADGEQSLGAGLRSRWNALHRSLNGGRGHSGGKRIFEHYKSAGLKGDTLAGKAGKNNLFVSAMPYDVFDGCVLHSPEYAEHCGIIAYLEYAAFADYSRSIKFTRPMFNVK